MSAGVYNFEIEQGADFDLHITYKDTDGAVVDLADLTYSSARMQIRESVDSTTVLLEATTTNGKITLSGTAPNIKIAIDHTVTDDLNFDTAFYDLELVGTSNTFVIKVLRGRVKLIKEFTK
tara:strand:+ start:362 stop:724 length:363 start_codon:yes stop_codon:yes gene_type:complete